MSFDRTFSAPPSQSFGSGRPLFMYSLRIWIRWPPTWRRKGTPASAMRAQIGSSSVWPGERPPHGAAGIHTALQPIPMAASSSSAARSGSSSERNATGKRRGSSAQKAAIARLCARHAPYRASRSLAGRMVSGENVEKTHCAWKPSRSSARERSPELNAPSAS